MYRTAETRPRRRLTIRSPRSRGFPSRSSRATGDIAIQGGIDRGGLRKLALALQFHVQNGIAGYVGAQVRYREGDVNGIARSQATAWPAIERPRSAVAALSTVT